MSQLDDLLAYEFALPGRGIFYRALAPQAADPDHSGFCDCAGCQCAAMHHVGIATPGFYMNSGELWAWCEREGTASRDPATIERARHEPGWLLFVGPGGDEHVAISTGGNRQFAAHSPSLGIGYASFDTHQWYGVAKIPGLQGYADQPITPPVPAPEPDMTPDQMNLVLIAFVKNLFESQEEPWVTLRQDFRYQVNYAIDHKGT